MKVELPNVELLNVPVPPETIDQAPVPTIGGFPPKEPEVSEPQTERVEGETDAEVGVATTISLLALTAVHGDMPVVVNVKVAVPLYPAGGVHVAFKSLGLGLKDPPAEVDHVPPVALPPTVPPSAADVPP